MAKLMITPDEIAAKAAEYYPYEDDTLYLKMCTERSRKDEFIRELRNQTIDMLRKAFAHGVKYAVVELNKK